MARKNRARRKMQKVQRPHWLENKLLRQEGGEEGGERLQNTLGGRRGGWDQGLGRRKPFSIL